MHFELEGEALPDGAQPVGVVRAEFVQQRERPPLLLVLYRDLALMKQRISVVVPEAAKAKVTFIVPAGVATDDISILDAGELTVSAIASPSDTSPVEEEVDAEVDETGALRKRANPPPSWS